MSWNQTYRLRYSVRSSLWIIPIIAIPLAMIATRAAHWLDPRLQWTFLGFGVKGAEALLQATVTATLSFLAFIRVFVGGPPGRERAADAPNNRNDPLEQ